jgi:hypothetical protein
MVPNRVVDDTRVRPQYWLCRSDDHSRFAYARIDDFFRQSDRTLWAHTSDGWLISARSGQRLAHQVGSVFYDAVTEEPVYFYEATY